MSFWKKRIASFGYAFKGIVNVFQSQPNFKIHCLAALIVTGLGFYFSISNVEWSIVIATIFSVFGAEAFNTSLEHLTDLTSPEYHPLAKKTKDTAAAGVLFFAIGAAIIGVLIFLPKIFILLSAWT